MPDVGQEYCVANWLSGHETPDVLAATLEAMDTAFQHTADREGVDLGAATWGILKPGDEFCPPVPAWLEKQVNALGRKAILIPIEGAEPLTGQSPIMLVCYRKVTEVKKQIKTRGFILDLADKDLQKLRAITKREYIKTHPGNTPLTDSEADAFIEQLGPDVAYELVAEKTVH